MPFIYLLSTDEQDAELAQAELRALAGCHASGRVGIGPVACDISRSAYVRTCAEIIAHGQSLDELCAEVAGVGLSSDGFRIDVHKLPPRPAEHGMDVARRIADCMRGWPDLSRPRERFAAICCRNDWWLARTISTGVRGDLAQQGRPRNLSQALSARHARALVNLVAAPGDTLLDPCCGCGTCLIEARHMGIRAWGSDIALANAFAARENLLHFGMPPAVAVADARTVRGQWDAVVIDFPYGHTTHPSEGLYEDVLNNLAPRALRIAVILGERGERLFERCGLEVTDLARVRGNTLVRHFYVLKGRRAPGPAMSRQE